MRHRFLCELRIRFVGVGDERDAAGCEHADAVHLAPFCEVARDYLFNVVGDVDAANIERAVLPQKGSDAAHIIPIIRVFVAAEAIYVRIEGIEETRQAVQVFALLAAGTEPLGEEEAEVAAGDFVAASVAGVPGDIAAAGGGGGLVFVFAVAAGPFVVPDVEDGAGLRGGFGFHGGVDLGAGGASFLAFYYLCLFFFGFCARRVWGHGCGVICVCEIGGGLLRRCWLRASASGFFRG